MFKPYVKSFGGIVFNAPAFETPEEAVTYLKDNIRKLYKENEFYIERIEKVNEYGLTNTVSNLYSKIVNGKRPEEEVVVNL